MPKTSIYQQKKKERVTQDAIDYYKQGFTTRQISAMLKELGTPRSHEWVAQVVKKMPK